MKPFLNSQQTETVWVTKCFKTLSLGLIYFVRKKHLTQIFVPRVEHHHNKDLNYAETLKLDSNQRVEGFWWSAMLRLSLLRLFIASWWALMRLQMRALRKMGNVRNCRKGNPYYIQDGKFSNTITTQTFTWHPTPVLLPGKSHGRRSLVGCSPWGR